MAARISTTNSLVPPSAQKLSVVRGSYSFVNNNKGSVTDRTNQSLNKTTIDKMSVLSQPRYIRQVDNSQERSLRKIEANQIFDTIPNPDINKTWNSLIRRRDA